MAVYSGQFELISPIAYIWIPDVIRRISGLNYFDRVESGTPHDVQPMAETQCRRALPVSRPNLAVHLLLPPARFATQPANMLDC